jgi:hypothetical protein
MFSVRIPRENKEDFRFAEAGCLTIVEGANKLRGCDSNGCSGRESIFLVTDVKLFVSRKASSGAVEET